jgi:hypothetical protein
MRVRAFAGADGLVLRQDWVTNKTRRQTAARPERRNAAPPRARDSIFARPAWVRHPLPRLGAPPIFDDSP